MVPEQRTKHLGGMVALHLVTGGNGYLGSHIAKKLLQNGHLVRVLDILDDPSRDPKIEYIKCDILNAEQVNAAMRGVDFVHHNAALVPVHKAGDQFWQVNVEGTRNVLEAAIKNQVQHFCYMSSSAVFGNLQAKDCPIQDDPPHLGAIEQYGASKAAGEQLVKTAMKDKRISASIVRPRTIVGTGRLGIFQILFEWISEGRNIYIIGPGNNLFQFAHTNDLVDVSIETCLKKKNGIYNIGTDNYRTLREDLQALCDRAGAGAKVRSLPIPLAVSTLWMVDKLGLSPLGPYHYMTYSKPYYFDLSTPLRELEWRPFASNTEILWSAYKWYIDHKSELQNNNSLSPHRGALKQGVLGILKRLS